MIAQQTNSTIKEINQTYGTMYYVEGINSLIPKSNGLWGYKILDKQNKITWIKLSNKLDIWAPINEYSE